MRTKKRAKAVRFGKKTEAVEKKREEKIPQEQIITNQTTSESVQPVSEKVIEQESVKEVVNANEAVGEKVIDQVNQQGVQIKDETQSTQAQNQDVISEPQVQAAQSATQVNQEITAEAVTKEAGGQELSPDEDAYTVQTDVEKNLVRYFIIIAVISFLVGIISMAGVSLFLQKGTFRLPFISPKIAQVTPSPAPTITPEPTKATVVNLAEYEIEILNGSGITGAASKLKTELTTDGYKVLSVGNADKSDYSETIISAKKEVAQEYLKKLKESLGKTYTLEPDSKTPLSGSSEADVVITIGSGTAGN